MSLRTLPYAKRIENLSLFPFSVCVPWVIKIPDFKIIGRKRKAHRKCCFLLQSKIQASLAQMDRAATF